MIRLKQLLAENNNINFPVIVNGSFSGDNGDRTHAFQSTGGVVVGGMQTQVNQKLKEIYDAGIELEVRQVFTEKNISFTIDLPQTKNPFN